MRILVVSPFLPHLSAPHAGGKLMSSLLTHLAAHHSVVLVSRLFPGEEGPAALLAQQGIETHLIPCSGPLVGRNPAAILRTLASYRALARKASTLLRQQRFDLCQVEYTQTGVFLSLPPGAPGVLTCHDVMAKPAYRRFQASRGLARLRQWALWRATQIAERRILSKFQRVFVLSDEDYQWAERLYPGTPLRVLKYPGGLDFVGLPRQEIARRVLFVGALNRRPNEDAVVFFLDRVWPTVLSAVPDAEFYVIGGGASEAFKARIAYEPQARMTGFVDSTEEYYRTAAVFAAPILVGGGIIVKILDAMAAAVPVVTTHYGNEGIRATGGQSVLVADTPRAFADAVVRLLESPGLRQEIGEGGKRHVREHFSQEALARTLEETYREAARSANNSR